MGRKPRIEYNGAIYHVIKRGNNREFIFREKEDKERFLNALDVANEEDVFNLLGYVIMDNHYHLIIETKDKPLHKIMQKINNTYSKDYNKRHKRRDHVFGGRYKAILVSEDKYLYALLRYIHSNPVRAKLAKNIADYRWSSDRSYRNNINKRVHIDKVLDMFSSNRKIALEEYKGFMDQKEATIKADDFYEEGSEIGELEKKNTADTPEDQNHQIGNLDGILRHLVTNEDEFQLIKSGSRKRSLRNNKVAYVKAAVAQGYTFKEIGKNIGMSATAANKMVNQVCCGDGGNDIL